MMLYNVLIVLYNLCLWSRNQQHSGRWATLSPRNLL